MLPMIRRIIPSIVAAEIIGVQPMAPFTDYKYLLFKDYLEVVSNMISVHTAIRPFMRENQLEPNHHYRPWLEEHIGVQGLDWNWDIHSVNGNLLAIDFANQEMATLFELTWP